MTSALARGTANAATAMSRANVAATSDVGTRHRAGATLTVAGIGKAFGGVHAVEGIDFEVHSGEILAVIGPNGAGKSTLLNLMSGIYRPDAGTISVGPTRRRVTRAGDLSRLGIARTFQNLALFEGLSVERNVAMGDRTHGRATLAEQWLGIGRIRVERAASKRKVDEILDLFDLTPFRDALIARLSYGIRKRVELARALVGAPKLLLLDEPLAGMDGDDRPTMARLIRAARDTRGTTIVLIEHDIGVVMSLADRIVVLDHGRKIAEGSPDAIRRDPAVIAAYLGREIEDGADA